MANETQVKSTAQEQTLDSQKMNIVFVGHVDHGKSTVIGRLLADTGSLPEGKLQHVKRQCEINSRPFEYAFLLDALKDEQSQGITIDMARCFFKTKKRHYIIIDAPGHIEFLKNMVTGAARAEAAILVIDANEGIRENSRRHGYLLSMLGIKQVVVCVNKMDLVKYDEKVYRQIKEQYSKFLKQIEIMPREFIPASAINGDNIAKHGSEMPWYEGKTVIEALDSFSKESDLADKPFRMFLQDVYKFTAFGDDRRICAGRVDSGQLNVGDDVIFLPSQKIGRVKTVEAFNANGSDSSIAAGSSVGFTLTEQIYVRRGELVCKKTETLPKVASEFRTNLFWMARKPMVMNRNYFLKVGTAKIPVRLKKLNLVIDASEIDRNLEKTQIDRHDVADCILETTRPVAFDLKSEIETTSRFVIVDNYEISGGGIIREAIIDQQHNLRDETLTREMKFQRSAVLPQTRAERYAQKPTLILITGEENTPRKEIAKGLEEALFKDGRKVYYLGIGNVKYSVDADLKEIVDSREEHLRRLGEVAYLFLDSGLITIVTARDLQDGEIRALETLIAPHDMLTVNLDNRDLKAANLLFLDGQLDVAAVVTEVKGWLKETTRIFSI